MPYLDDSTIRHKFQQLEQLENRIENLELQLRDAREYRVKLESEIRSYQDGRAGIQKLPPELLAEVFRHYVNDNPSAIRRLLQVCRQWHDIVKSDKQLWTCIRIKVGADEGVESVRSRAQYIKACFSVSGNLPLELEIDFDRLSSLSGFCAKAAHHALLPLFKTDCPHTNEAFSIPDDSQARVRQWIDVRRPHYSRRDSPLPLNEIYEENCAYILRCMAGTHGEYMARCRSFKFTGPRWEWTTECDHYVYSLLQRPMPLLEKLSLNRIHTTRFITPDLRAKPLDQLRALVLEDSVTFNRLAGSVALPQLSSLTLANARLNEEDIRLVFQCVNLTTLTILSKSPHHFPPLDLEPVTLGKLISLTVNGSFSEEIFEKMDLPVLEHLSIDLGVLAWAPRADFLSRASKICLKAPNPAQYDPRDKPQYQELLRTHLSLFRSMVLLMIDAPWLESVKDAIRYLASRGNNLPCLRGLGVPPHRLQPARMFLVEHLDNDVQFVEEDEVPSFSDVKM